MKGVSSNTKRLNSRALAIFGAWVLVPALLLCPAAAPARAQEEAEGLVQQQQEDEPAGRRRGDAQAAREQNLILRLNLKPEQVAQIRQIRQQSWAEGAALGRRLRQARRALDEAMLSENVDEALIEARTRDVAEAQGAIIRLRVQTEMRVRRVLTPEQLTLFRELHRQAGRRQRLERRERRTRGGDLRQPREALDAVPRQPPAEAPPDNTRRQRPGWLTRPRRRGALNRP